MFAWMLSNSKAIKILMEWFYVRNEKLAPLGAFGSKSPAILNISSLTFFICSQKIKEDASFCHKFFFFLGSFGCQTSLGP